MASIGEDIETGIRPLDAGLSNIGRVNVSNTEDYIPGYTEDEFMEAESGLYANV